jgi:hypothetical protein
MAMDPARRSCAGHLRVDRQRSEQREDEDHGGDWCTTRGEQRDARLVAEGEK